MAVCFKSVLGGGGGGQSMHVDTLTITTQPTKKIYIQNEKIDTTGMVVNASAYGMSGNVTQYCTVSPQILGTAGTQTVTVSFGDATATFTVTVEELVSVSITSQPTKTAYIQGEALDLTGIAVTARSATQTRTVTTTCEFTPANGSTLSTTGSITVTASFGGMSDTTTVTSYAVTGIEITTPPRKVNYGIDEALDLTGIVVTATAGILTSDVTSQCTFSPANGTVFTEEGNVTLTASYMTFTDSMIIDVSLIGELENTTWEKIKLIGSSGIGSQYWSIGDTKTIALNGTVGTVELNNYQCKVFIIDFNYRGDNGIYFQGFKTTDSTPIDIALCDSYYEQIKTDGTKAFTYCHYANSQVGGWKGSDLRYDILGSTDVAPSGYGSAPTSGRTGYDATNTCATNPVANTLMSALPSDLRAVLAPWTIYTDNNGSYSESSANVTTSIDYLPLLAEFEVRGIVDSTTKSNLNESTNNKQMQMTYYSSNSAIKKKNTSTTTSVNWWLRSPSRSFDSHPVCVLISGSCNAYAGGYSLGLSPAFRVA